MKIVKQVKEYIWVIGNIGVASCGNCKWAGSDCEAHDHLSEVLFSAGQIETEISIYKLTPAVSATSDPDSSILRHHSLLFKCQFCQELNFRDRIICFVHCKADLEVLLLSVC